MITVCFSLQMRYLQVDAYKLSSHKWLMSLSSLYENLILFSQWKSEIQLSYLKSIWFWFRWSIISYKSHHWQNRSVKLQSSETGKNSDLCWPARPGISEEQDASQNSLNRGELWRPLGPAPAQNFILQKPTRPMHRR